MPQNTVAAALSFEMLFNQVETWTLEKKQSGDLKGIPAVNNYRMGVSQRVLRDAETENSQLLKRAEEEEQKRVREEAAAAEASRAAEIARLAVPAMEDIPEPRVKIEDVPEEDTHVKPEPYTG